jgi:glutamine transport system substrate-binding protein
MAILAVALALFVFCQRNANSDKLVRVGCDTNFMPFEFKGDSSYVGFDIDLWDAIAKRMNVSYKLVPMDFNGLIPALQAGNMDVALAGMTIKAEREKIVDFSYPYYQSGLALAVRANEKRITGIDDLKDKIIATKLGTTSADFAKSIKCKNVKLFPNIDAAYLELQAKGADAVVFDVPAIQYYRNTDGKGKVKIVGPVYKGQSYGIAFPAGSKLRDRVDVALLELMEDGSYDSIYAKWFGKSNGH